MPKKFLIVLEIPENENEAKMIQNFYSKESQRGFEQGSGCKVRVAREISESEYAELLAIEKHAS